MIYLWCNGACSALCTVWAPSALTLPVGENFHLNFHLSTTETAKKVSPWLRDPSSGRRAISRNLRHTFLAISEVGPDEDLLRAHSHETFESGGAPLIYCYSGSDARAVAADLPALEQYFCIIPRVWGARAHPPAAQHVPRQYLYIILRSSTLQI